MTEIRFKTGDRVRHDKRPEWGIGQVQRVENVHVAGKPAQRLVIRFSNAGQKTISSLGAVIRPMPVEMPRLNGSANAEPGTLVDREGGAETGWLGAISKEKPEGAMVELPHEATDPFLPREARFKATLDLYRFQPTGRSLIDWAVARSGLEDPLSRFTRHELEQFFERWAFLRGKHLAKLVEEMKHDNGAMDAALQSAPHAARRAVGTLTGRR